MYGSYEVGWFGGLGLTVAVWLCALCASAQQPELSPGERQAAAEAAYDRGTHAFQANEWERAARWYVTADQLAPSANALIQAMRAFERAGDRMRSANLALALHARYGEERMAQQTGDAIERAAELFVRLEIACEDCQLEVDGERVTHATLFVTPDTEHVVSARFATGTVEERLSAPPGERRELSLEAPAEAEPALEPEPDPEPAPAQELEPAPEPRPSSGPSGSGGAFVTMGAVLTAVAGGTLIWSGLDTLSAAQDYDAAPTRAKLEAGRDLELRTNLLIGVTGGLGLLTFVGALLLVDWGGGDDVSPTAGFGPGWVALGVRGSFR